MKLPDEMLDHIFKFLPSPLRIAFGIKGTGTFIAKVRYIVEDDGHYLLDILMDCELCKVTIYDAKEMEEATDLPTPINPFYKEYYKGSFDGAIRFIKARWGQVLVNGDPVEKKNFAHAILTKSYLEK